MMKMKIYGKWNAVRMLHAFIYEVALAFGLPIIVIQVVPLPQNLILLSR